MSIAYDCGRMSPAPARTSVDAIVAAARRILEADGLAARHDAQRRRGGGRQGPVALQAGPRSGGAPARGRGQRRGRPRRGRWRGRPRPTIRAPTCAPPPLAYRAFVRRNPNGYRLLFTDLPSGASPDPAILAAVGEPLVGRWRRSPASRDALEAARTFVAWAHGFVSMELAGRLPARRRPRSAYAVRDRVDPGRRQRAGDPSIRLTRNSTRNTPTTSARAPISRGCA